MQQLQGYEESVVMHGWTRRQNLSEYTYQFCGRSEIEKRGWRNRVFCLSM